MHEGRRVPPGHDNDAAAWAEIAALQVGMKKVADRRLGVGAGDRVLDVGSGLGADVLRLAAAVGETGGVVGIDADRGMVEASIETARAAGLCARVQFCLGDAAALPFADGAFDGVRSERLLVHVPDPALAVAEMARVLRAGGRLVTAETDLATMSVDTDFPEVEQIVRDARSQDLRRPFAGRRVYGLCRSIGLRDVEVDVVPMVVRTMAARRRITAWDRVCGRLVGAGALSSEEREALEGDLADRDRRGVFFAYGVYLVTSARRP